MNIKRVNAIVGTLGFIAREVPNGFFLAESRRDRFGLRLPSGDDKMLVKHDGEVVVYVEDAQAYFAAKTLSNMMVR